MVHGSGSGRQEAAGRSVVMALQKTAILMGEAHVMP